MAAGSSDQAGGPPLRTTRGRSSPAAGSWRRDVRVMSYNMHGLAGPSGALEATVRDAAPAVLVIQECLRWTAPRSWWADLAGRFGMARMDGGLSARGNAVLTSGQVAVDRSWVVRYPWRLGGSPRAAVFVRASYGGSRFVVAGTHLDTDPATRLREATAFKAALDEVPDPVVVGIDVNETPGGAAWEVVAAGLVDAALPSGQGGTPTYPTGAPQRRIDAVFVDPRVAVRGYAVPNTATTRAASDHFPVVVDVDLP